jgi:transcription-repair coupling factor (superfamily II helicase)
VHSALNLSLDIRIPSEYIADDQQRLQAYKRVAGVTGAEDAEKIRTGLADRYGPPPEAVETLVLFALLKTKAQAIGVEAIDRRSGALTIKFHPASKIAPERLMSLVASVHGAQFTPAGVLRLPLPPNTEKPAAVLEFVKEALDGLAPAAG